MESAPRSVAAAYAETIQTGAIESDPEQLRVISELDCLLTRLEAIESANTSLLTRLFGSRKQQEPFKGLYIWGSVGRGKTMLMDMFFDAVPLTQKRRVHFHSFMAEVHAGIHAWRQAKKSGSLKGEDPISPVAEKLAAEARLLCLWMSSEAGFHLSEVLTTPRLPVRSLVMSSPTRSAGACCRPDWRARS